MKRRKYYKRYYLTAICILFILCVGGCSAHGTSVLSEETEIFDLGAAVTMIQELESPILKLEAGNRISRSEYEELQNKYDLFLREGSVNGVPLEIFFDGAEVEDSSKLEFTVIDNMRYPTIFDEDIEIVEAYVKTTVYDLGNNMTRSSVLLCIKQGYVGEDANMKEFNRSYLFIPDDNGGWVFNAINGRVNLPLDGNW